MFYLVEKNITKKTSSNDYGRAKLATALQILTDGLLDDFKDRDVIHIKHQSDSCYKPYTYP